MAKTMPSDTIGSLNAPVIAGERQSTVPFLESRATSLLPPAAKSTPLAAAGTDAVPLAFSFHAIDHCGAPVAASTACRRAAPVVDRYGMSSDVGVTVTTFVSGQTGHFQSSAPVAAS